MFIFLESTTFEIWNESVTFTEAFHRCQLAQPKFHFDNISFKLSPDDSMDLQNDTDYWLGYITTDTAFHFLGKWCQK